MNPKAVAKAKQRLRIAQQQLDAAEKSADYAAFTDAWYLFLVAAKNIYTALEQGSKTTAQSRQWFGAVKRFRKDDPLLQYLFEARNDDEHGLADVTRLHPGGVVSLALNAPGYATGIIADQLVIEDGIISWANLRSTDGKPILAETIPAHAVLIPITGRGNIVYQPPTEHLGKPLANQLPVAVGKLGLTYLESLIADAEARAS